MADPMLIYVEPDAVGGDGTIEFPLGSIVEARDLIRTLRGAEQINGPVEVRMMAGTYRQEETIEFELQDSGTEEWPVTFKSYGVGEAIVTAGVPVEGTWSTHSGSVMQIDLPGQAAFQTLIVGGTPAIRARTPNVGSYYMMAPYSPGEGLVKSYFWAEPADLPFPAEGEVVEVNSLQGFSHVRCYLGTIEEFGDPRKVNITGEPVQAFNQRPDYGRYWYENSLSFLDSPGEFYHDETLERLYYWPRDGETLGTTEVLIPAINTLISVAGEPNTVEITGSFSVSIWFRTNYTNAATFWEKHLISNAYQTAGAFSYGYSLFMRKQSGNDGFIFVSLGAANYAATSVTGLNDGNIHNAIAVFDRDLNEFRVYVDGVLAGQGALSGSIADPSNVPPRLGHASDSSYWSGTLGEAIILSRAVDGADAALIYDRDYATLTADMLMHMPLAGTFVDQAGTIGDVRSYSFTFPDTAPIKSNPVFVADAELGQMLSFNGTSDVLGMDRRTARPASWINFEGLTFSDVDWKLLPGGHSEYEGGYNVLESTAIIFSHAADCEIRNCVLRNLQSTGVQSYRSKRINIVENNIGPIGGSPIVVAGLADVADTVGGFSRIEGNEVHNYGSITKGAIGISAYYCGTNDIRQNQIHHGTYMGIRCSGNYSSIYASTGGNLVEYNEIYAVMQELNDGGGIYFKGWQIDSTARGNQIHDCVLTDLHVPDSGGIYGIYLDESANGVLVTNNLVYRIARIGAFVHISNNNEIVNNVIVDCGQASAGIILNGTKPAEDGSVFVYPITNNFTHNILYNADPSVASFRIRIASEAYIAGIPDPIADSDFNFWGSSVVTQYVSSPVSDTEESLDWLRSEYGQETNTLVGNPLFKDYAGDNFTLEPDSPAYQIGFVDLVLSPDDPNMPDILTGKVHHYDLFADFSSGGGSVSAPLTQNGVVTLSGGRAGGFSAANYLAVPSPTVFNGLTERTFSIHGTAASVGGTQAIWSFGTDGTNTFNLYPVRTGIPAYFSLFINNAWRGPATAPLSAGVEYHFVVTVDADNLVSRYLDGVLVDSFSETLPFPATVLSGRLGTYYGNPANFWGGSLGQFKSYTRALSAADVAALYEADTADLEAFRSDGQHVGTNPSPFLRTIIPTMFSPMAVPLTLRGSR